MQEPARIFNGLGLWSQLNPLATPIKNIHISDRGHPGITRLDAKQFNVAAMGYVLELEDAGKVIHKALADSKTKIYCPAKVTKISSGEDHANLTIESSIDKSTKTNEQQIRARLVIAADGNDSVVRTMTGVGSQAKPYTQTAIISTIQTQRAHQNVAYERFTDTGPLAFLPLSNNRTSIVWMVDTNAAEKIVSANDAIFINQLQSQFGQRLGRITRVGKRYAYPLSLVKADHCIDNRLVIIGNAAQSLHPIAGQGLNLGLRDVAALADILRTACLERVDPGSATLLEEYQVWRRPDRQQVVAATDIMARLFTNPAAILSKPRNLMLMAMNLLPEVRSQLAEAAMGLRGVQPRLIRGLTLDLQEK